MSKDFARDEGADNENGIYWLACGHELTEDDISKLVRELKCDLAYHGKIKNKARWEYCISEKEKPMTERELDILGDMGLVVYLGLGGEKVLRFKDKPSVLGREFTPYQEQVFLRSERVTN